MSTDDQPTAAAMADFDDALARVFAGVERATKDATNPHLKNRYATLASVDGACREALIAEGFSWPQPVTLRRIDGIMEVVVTTQLRRKGVVLEGSLPMPVGGKATAQEIGSAITYGRRYALASMLGVCTEDDDGNAASQRKAKGRSAPEPDDEPVDRLWMAYEERRDAVARARKLSAEQAHTAIREAAHVAYAGEPSDEQVEAMIAAADGLLRPPAPTLDPEPTGKAAAVTEYAAAARAFVSAMEADYRDAEGRDPSEDVVAGLRARARVLSAQAAGAEKWPGKRATIEQLTAATARLTEAVAALKAGA